MYITEEYKKQQRIMHETNSAYGVQSIRYTEAVRILIKEYGFKTVLDYGCGKGELKKRIGDIVTEFDPGIKGKDNPPEGLYELVVCTDVLEHIEPEFLIPVLEQIRSLASRKVMLAISCRPAAKTLPDGRNAHLIVENRDWWLEKIRMFFRVDETRDIKENLFLLVCTPLLMIGEIKTVTAMNDEERIKNIRKALSFTERRISVVPPHARVAIVVNYGPSLQETWKGIIEEKEAIKKADIISVSGAHDFLIEKGIFPRYQIECDPRPHKADRMKLKSKETEYLFASCVHPKVFKSVEKEKVIIWHSHHNDIVHDVIKQSESMFPLIMGGGCVGLRAFGLLQVLGYRRFIVHGMDFSYRETTHAGPHTGKETQKLKVSSYGREFITSPVHLAYLNQFNDVMKHCGDTDKDPTKLEIVLRGDGLLQHSVISAQVGHRGKMPFKDVA